jgi:hypothetical protein
MATTAEVGYQFGFQAELSMQRGIPLPVRLVFNISGFVERAQLNENDLISIEIHQECNDGLCAVVKSVNLSVSAATAAIIKTMDNSMNLRYPCIAGVIGVVIRSDLGALQIVQIMSVVFHCRTSSQQHQNRGLRCYVRPEVFSQFWTAPWAFDRE